VSFKRSRPWEEVARAIERDLPVYLGQIIGLRNIRNPADEERIMFTESLLVQFNVAARPKREGVR